jgi:HK97 gp10 family phage protein
MAGLFGYRPSTNIKKALTQVPEVRRQVRRAAAEVRDEARRNARASGVWDTGAGAKSIKVESLLIGGANEYHVSWDREHFYMGFHELGAINVTARPFLRPAADLIQRGVGSTSADFGE